MELENLDENIIEAQNLNKDLLSENMALDVDQEVAEQQKNIEDLIINNGLLNEQSLKNYFLKTSENEWKLP
jgi:short-subunit dehydrogenase